MVGGRKSAQIRADFSNQRPCDLVGDAWKYFQSRVRKDASAVSSLTSKSTVAVSICRLSSGVGR